MRSYLAQRLPLQQAAEEALGQVLSVFGIVASAAIAAAGLIYGFVELTHLLQTDAVGHVAAKAISLD